VTPIFKHESRTLIKFVLRKISEAVALKAHTNTHVHFLPHYALLAIDSIRRFEGSTGGIFDGLLCSMGVTRITARGRRERRGMEGPQCLLQTQVKG
jgi:hypothetical protein